MKHYNHIFFDLDRTLWDFDAAAEVDVCIPAHAFEFLKLREKSYKATDLLGNTTTELRLGADQTVHTEVPARYAVVYKLRG